MVKMATVDLETNNHADPRRS